MSIYKNLPPMGDEASIADLLASAQPVERSNTLILLKIDTGMITKRR